MRPAWHHRTLAARALVGVLAAACSVITGSDQGEEPALIRYYGQDAKITLPDTVNPGQEFVVKIATIGGGCTRSVSRTVVDRTLGTSLYLYNRTNRSTSVCTADLIMIDHEAVLKFDAVSDQVIRIFGTNSGAETNGKTVAWVGERIVKVRKIPGVLIVPGSTAMAVGQSTRFTATALPAVPNPRWTWTSSDPVAVPVDSTGFARALQGPRTGVTVCAALVSDPAMSGCASIVIVPP